MLISFIFINKFTLTNLIVLIFVSKKNFPDRSKLFFLNLFVSSDLPVCSYGSRTWHSTCCHSSAPSLSACSWQSRDCRCSPAAPAVGWSDLALCLRFSKMDYFFFYLKIPSFSLKEESPKRKFEIKIL